MDSIGKVYLSYREMFVFCARQMLLIRLVWWWVKSGAQHPSELRACVCDCVCVVCAHLRKLSGHIMRPQNKKNLKKSYNFRRVCYMLAKFVHFLWWQSQTFQTIRTIRVRNSSEKDTHSHINPTAIDNRIRRASCIWTPFANSQFQVIFVLALIIRAIRENTRSPIKFASIHRSIVYIKYGSAPNCMTFVQTYICF